MKDIDILRKIEDELEKDIYRWRLIAHNMKKNIYSLYDLHICSEKIGMINSKFDDVYKNFKELEDTIRDTIMAYVCTSPPLVIHQDIVLLICNALLQYKINNKLDYRVLNSPIKVVFGNDEKYYEPDIIVVFDTEKIKKDGCYGAPDIVMEVVSRSTAKKDYSEKKNYYLSMGVKEYVIIDPRKKRVSIIVGEEKIIKAFNEDLCFNTIPGLKINIQDMLRLF